MSMYLFFKDNSVSKKREIKEKKNALKETFILTAHLLIQDNLVQIREHNHNKTRHLYSTYVPDIVLFISDINLSS